MSTAGAPGELWLVRHGETEWTASGKHTSRSDVPLSATGRAQATSVGGVLAGRPFATVLSSPLSRAVETCRLAGYGDRVETDDDLMEWDYGEYEGLTTAEIRAERPGWTVWAGSPGGEPLDGVASRARRVIDRATEAGGDAALFSHGHFLRILGATWMGLPPDGGRLLSLGTASLSTLGYERETRVIRQWNRSCEVGEATRMPVEPVTTPNAPPVAGPYSPAVRAGDWLVLAGQVGLEVAAGRLAEGGAEGEARQALANITTVLADCGASWVDVAKVTIFVTDIADFAVVNEAYGAAVGDHRPARSTVQVAALPAGAKVEIEVWAHKPV